MYKFTSCYFQKEKNFSTCLKPLSLSLLSFPLIYLSIYLFVSFSFSDESRRNRGKNFSRLKILRERKTAFLRFEDDLYVYVVQSSRLSQVYVHSIFWCIFYLLCWWKHRWKWVGEHFLSKIGEIISINVENIGKQFSRIDTHRVAWNIFKKRMSLIYIYISSIFFTLRFSRTLFKLSSYALIKHVRFFKFQVFKHFLPFSQIYIFIFFFFTGNSNFLEALLHHLSKYI